MVWSQIRTDALLEIAVMFFQVIGVATLCLSRLFPSSRWADGGRIGFVMAMVGLGVFGAACGRHDSEFALFAGGTMTVLPDRHDRRQRCRPRDRPPGPDAHPRRTARLVKFRGRATP